MSTTWTSIINTEGSATIDHENIGGSSNTGGGTTVNNYNFDGLMNNDEPLIFGNSNEYKIQYSSDLTGLQFICEENLEPTDVMFNFNDTVKVYKGGPTEFVSHDAPPPTEGYPEGSIINVNGKLKILKEL
jgi:hypothetical protein